MKTKITHGAKLIITKTLKKVLFSDDKNMQQVHNICCSWIKTDLWCNFIVMILTRMGLHTFMLRDCTYRRAPVCRVWHVQARVFCLSFFKGPSLRLLGISGLALSHSVI